MSRARRLGPAKMDCIYCHQPTKVTNSQGWVGIIIYRSRKCKNGHIFTTKETVLEPAVFDTTEGDTNVTRS